ncbi:MAG TPA: GRP family sugar transporter [Bryobacteraceae bacterium]
MLIPTSSAAALFLLLLSLVCLGSWANTLKLAGKRWPYELFYIDFAIGALILAGLAAYTLGTSGDPSFADRMLVAGRTAQAWVVLAGFIFNFGNILLVAAISLVGMASAFPLAAGIALVITCAFHLRLNNSWLLIPGIGLMIVAAILAARSCRENTGFEIGPSRQTGKATSTMRRPVRGILAAVLGGVGLGFFYPVAANSMDPEYGVGPYAGILLFSIGLFCSTILFDVFFINMNIEGKRARFRDYFRGRARKHLLSLGGGAVFAIGALAVTLVNAAPADPGIGAALAFIIPSASVLLAVIWGLSAWKEFTAASKQAKSSIARAVIVFTCGLLAIGFGMAR